MYKVLWRPAYPRFRETTFVTALPKVLAMKALLIWRHVLLRLKSLCVQKSRPFAFKRHVPSRLKDMTSPFTFKSHVPCVLPREPDSEIRTREGIRKWEREREREREIRTRGGIRKSKMKRNWAGKIIGGVCVRERERERERETHPKGDWAQAPPLTRRVYQVCQKWKYDAHITDS